MRFKGCFLSCVAVGLLTVVVFALGVTGGHLGIDDWSYTYGCPFVKDGLTSSGIARAFSDFGYCSIWMPLTFLSYMADISLFGGGWMAHHAVNVALHGFNAALAFLLLLTLLRRLASADGRTAVWSCAAAALFWALHPMRAEAVTFVASRKEELWTLFTLAGLLVWIRFLDRGGAVRYLAALACMVAGCLSKPTAMCFPLLAFLLQAVLTDRAFRRLWLYLPQLAVALVTGLIAVFSQAHPTGLAEAGVFDAALEWRLLNAAVALGLYVWHTVMPWGVHFDYRAVFGGWPVQGGLGLAALGVTTLLAAWGVLYAPRRKIAVFAAAWFLFGLLPTLGIFGYVNGDQACADRYAYLPAIALSLPLAAGLLAVRGRFRWGLAAAAVAGEIALAVPAIRSFGSDAAAYARVLARDPDHWRALRVLGNEYCARQGRMDEGVAMLRRSLRLHASQLTADSLAYVLAIRGKQGDLAEVKRLGAAVAHDFRKDVHGMMLDALAIAYMREGDDRNAERLFRAALTVPRRNHSPGHSLLNLGLTLANLGRDAEARTMLGKATEDVHPEVRARAAAALDTLRSGGKRERFLWQ